MMDAEMIRMIQVVLQGIAVNDETLTMDVIHQVGPGGSYIANEHTYHSMKNQSQTKLFDRRSRERWLSVTKGESLVDRAYQSAIDILETHEPYPLPESAVETMQEIVEEFEKELGSGK
jgi:trimethylamine--corrinoid protein Co-methyltransferase